MKKTILVLLSLVLTSSLFAQKNAELKFETNFYDAINQWVVLPKKPTDTIYTYGFIYVDIYAGITFHLGGSFYIDKNEKYIGDEQPAHQIMKKRLDNPNIVKMAILSDHILKELNLSKEPDWLSSYKFSEDSVENLKQLGFHYNHVGACEKALIYLNKAYKKEPHYKGLEFEIAYAYNHLGQYDKAIPILEKALKNDSKNYSFYRELGFAFVKQNRLNDAEKIYTKGISLSDNKFEKSEMALNMAQGYFLAKNKVKFTEWAEITRKYAEKDSQYSKYIDFFEKEWNSER
jgi:tetratricopeptide (TPR) repeat protein